MGSSPTWGSVFFSCENMLFISLSQPLSVLEYIKRHFLGLWLCLRLTLIQLAMKRSLLSCIELHAYLGLCLLVGRHIPCSGSIQQTMLVSISLEPPPNTSTQVCVLNQMGHWKEARYCSCFSFSSYVFSLLDMMAKRMFVHVYVQVLILNLHDTRQKNL